MWYLQESNQGHTDFQSVALPTELRYLAICDPKHRTRCVGGCKYRYFIKYEQQVFVKYFGSFFILDRTTDFQAVMRAKNFLNHYGNYFVSFCNPLRLNISLAITKKLLWQTNITIPKT